MNIATKRKPQSSPPLSVSGDDLSKHFSSVVSSADTYKFWPSLSSKISTDIDTSFILQPLSEEDIWKELSTLNVHKATGPDNIPGKFLKFAANIISAPLTKLFNKSIETATFPCEWKRAHVIPIHKGGSTE